MKDYKIFKEDSIVYHEDFIPVLIGYIITFSLLLGRSLQ